MALGMNVFVTVGTTQFDELITTISNQETKEILRRLGYSTITAQIGNCEFEPKTGHENGITLEYFRLKSSISDNIDAADLVISHAGAGCILEALEASKPLVVVINEKLMGNHQTELAKKLADEGYLTYCTCRDLAQTLKHISGVKFRSYERGQPQLFTSFLDSMMGFRHQST